jgi:SAM-dependent methyltransferase
MEEPLTFTTPCICRSERFRRVPGFRLRTCEIVRCEACGQLRTYPEPRPEDLATIYDANSSQKYTVERDESYFSQWQGFAVQMVDLLERHVERGRLLDVGCDQAIALLEARDRGWTVAGVELNSVVAGAVATRTGITIHDQPIETLSLPEESFDAIICNQVIEHLADPNAVIATFRRLLRPGGVVFIGTPCFTAPIGTVLLRDRWYALVPSEHLWQFGPLTLRRLIRQNGLEIVHSGRGCTPYWGELPRSPKRLLRWLVFRAVAVAGQGDFLNYVARR